MEKGIEEGLRSRMEELQKDIMKNPSRYGAGLREVVADVEAPFIARPEEKKEEKKEEEKKIKVPEGLVGGYGESLRSKFESLTTSSSPSGMRFSGMVQGQGLVKKSGYSAPEETHDEIMRKRLLKKKFHRKMEGVRRAVSKKRALEEFRQRIIK